MIFCDSCEYWYHYDCLGLDAFEIDSLSDDNNDFICLNALINPHHMGPLTLPHLLPHFYGMICQGLIFQL